MQNSTPKTILRRAIATLLLITSALVANPSAQAAAITFSTPAYCSSDADVIATGGNQLFAFTWGGATTVNGVAFTATAATATPGFNLNLTSFTGANGTVFTANAAPFNTLSPAYTNILRGSVFNGTAFTFATATLNNLTPGHNYFVQLWASDPRGTFSNRVVDVSSGGPVVRLDFNSINNVGGVGQYTYGTFTADATTQDILLDATTLVDPDSGVPQINAIQLRDITGVWSGTTDGNWIDTDNSSLNFSGLNYTAVKAVTTDVYFGDKDAAGGAVANSTVIIGAGGVTGANVTFNNSSVAYTLNPADAVGITGAYGVTLSGAGNVALNGVNTYSGNTTINAGTLSLGLPGAIGNSAAVVLNGGTLDTTSVPGWTLGASQTLRGAGTIRGNVAAASGATIVPGGSAAAGTLTITNNLTLNGQTMTFDLPFSPFGCDLIAVGNTLTVNGTCTIALNYLDGSLAGGTYTLMTFSTKAGLGSLVLDAAYPGVTLNVNPTSVTLTVAGGGGTSGVFTNLAGGTWSALTNWQDNIIATNVDGIADFSTLDITANRTVTINGIKTIGHLVFGDTVQNANWTLSTGTNILAVTTGSPNIIVNSGQTTTISASLAGSQGFTKRGSGNLLLTGANTLVGGINVIGGALNLNSAGALGSTLVPTANPVWLSNANLIFSTATPAKTFTNNFVFAGTSNAIIQTSAAQTVIAGSFSGSGIVNISTPGTIVTAHRGDMSGFSGTILVTGSAAGNNAGGFLMGQGDTTSFVAGSSNAVFDYEGNTLNYLYNGSAAGSSATVYMGALVGNNGNAVLNGKNSLGSAVGDVTIEVGALNTDTAFAGTLKDYAGATPGTPAPKLGIRKVGAGNLTLSGTAANTGPTEVRNGSLTILGSLAAPVTVFSGATFKLGGSLGSATLTVNSGGTLLVGSGANLGSAAVAVNGLMDVTPAAGSFSLNSASLSGSGVVTGAVSMASSAINPGPVGGAGSLTITNGDFTANGGSVNIDLSNDATNGANDVLVVNGNLNLNGPVTININKLTGTLGSGHYRLITFSGALVGDIANFLLSGAGPLDVLQQNGNGIDLVVSPVPTVTWTGGVAGNLWDVNTSQNWILDGFKIVFTNGEAALFSDLGATNPVVTVPATVQPAAVVVSSSSNYTFTGGADIGDGAALTKAGTGTLTILNANTFIGGTFINGGTLKLGDGASVNGSVAGNIADNGTLLVANPADQTISGVISGSGALVKQGAGKLTLTGTNLLTGPTTISAGALVLGDNSSANGSLGTGVVMNNSLLMFNEIGATTIGNNITGTGGIVNNSQGAVILSGSVSGSGKLTNDYGATTVYLNASNSYSGGTFINAGAVVINDSTLHGLGSGAVVINDGVGTLRIGTFGSNVLANAIQLPPNSTGEQFTMLSVNAGFVTVRLTNVLSGGAPGQITPLVNTAVTGNNRATLILDNPANSFTTIPEAYSGTLAFTSDGALGDVNNGVSINCAAHVNTTFFNRADDGLRFDANNITVNASRTIDLVGSENINVQGNNGTIAGPITGLALTKRGTGTLTLNGTGSLAAGTTVNAGTLLINNTWNASTVVVASGATLGGIGTINGSVSVASGGALAPGASIGTLTVTNALTLNAGSTTTMEINAGSLTCDKVIGINTLSYEGTLTVNNTGGSFALGQSFQLFSADSYSSDFTTVNVPTLGVSGAHWNWNPANGTLSVVSDVATNPTNITAVVSGGNLNLSWPADHTGWRLEVQTNTLSVGVANNWFTWPNSTNVNAVSVPINPANPSVFFRLTLP